jgi:hypothetical protein
MFCRMGLCPSDKFSTRNLVLDKIKKRGAVRRAARSLALRGGSDCLDLIYSPVVCFLKVFMRSLRSVFGSFFIRTKGTAPAAIERDGALCGAENILSTSTRAELTRVIEMTLRLIISQLKTSPSLLLFSVNFFTTARYFRQKIKHLLCMHKTNTEYRFELWYS